MSVLKSKRKPSQFEVFHQLTKLRKDITDLLLRDFGFDTVKAEKRLEKRFGKPFRSRARVHPLAAGSPQRETRLKVSYQRR